MMLSTYMHKDRLRASHHDLFILAKFSTLDWRGMFSVMQRTLQILGPSILRRISKNEPGVTQATRLRSLHQRRLNAVRIFIETVRMLLDEDRPSKNTATTDNKTAIM